ncbi:hypothetical protein [Thalassoroseus pseudoceratinae]|uniref:hypothetical protein n=1 Tax=Thalassoroseus pseudoceratinae TaxID=2713176 RepID=UPI001423DCA1|nr:hypothetical protein [Thalassoroseus pseudoceratinae]
MKRINRRAKKPILPSTKRRHDDGLTRTSSVRTLLCWHDGKHVERHECAKCGREYESPDLWCENGCHFNFFIGKVSIYFDSVLSNSVSCYEASEVKFGHQRHAQYEHCPFLYFKERGKRRGSIWHGSSIHWVVVLRGWMPGLDFDQVNALAGTDECIFEDRSEAAFQWREKRHREEQERLQQNVHKLNKIGNLIEAGSGDPAAFID